MIDVKAELTDHGFDKDRKRRITFTAALSEKEIESISGKPVRLTVKDWREKRSLDANGYYWVLLSRLAEVLKISKPRAHNILLRRYGQILTVDGQKAIIFLPDTENAEEMALEASTFHVRPTSHTKPGKESNFRAYVLLKGSSAYDSAEMAVLLDGLIAECEQVGIETATPDEIRRMKELYEQTEKKHHSSG